MSHKKHLLILTLLFIVFAPGIFFSNNAPAIAVAQSTSMDLSGWAWSSNIGWISFNSQDCTITTTSNILKSSCGGDGKKTTAAYKVYLDSSNNLVGYAWSSNIGYIYFGNSATAAGGIASAPANPKTWAKYDPATGKVSGWARACSVFKSGCGGALRSDIGDNGGWDGWISLSGTNYGVVGKEISSTRTDFSGFAWGGGVPVVSSPQFPGWINFNYKKNQDGTPVTPLPPNGGCTSNCGPVFIGGPEEVPFNPGSCVVVGKPLDGNNVNLEIGQSVTLRVNPEGVNTYTTEWSVGGNKVGSGSEYTFTATASGQYEVTAKINGDSRLVNCPSDNGKIVVFSTTDPTALFTNLGLTDMTVRFTDNTRPTIAYHDGMNLPQISIEDGNRSKTCNAQFELKIDKITNSVGDVISDKYYTASFDQSKIQTVQKPTAKLTLVMVRRPNNLAPLPTGTYQVHISGVSTPPDSCSKDPSMQATLRVTSSTGGVYIEQ